MKTYGVPAILSLLMPGFGQLVKGHIGKYLVIAMAAAALLLNWMYGWLLGDSEYLSLLSLVLYYILTAVSVYDAYNAEHDFKDGTFDNRSAAKEENKK